MTFSASITGSGYNHGVLAIANGGTNSTAAATLEESDMEQDLLIYTGGNSQYYNPQLEQPLFGRR
jgi:hypothetical protein